MSFILESRLSNAALCQVVLQRMASNLNIKAARRDPVKEFPAEVTSMVFALLDVTTLR